MIDGETFDEKLDGKRLNRQQRAVRDLMQDGQWRTLREVADAVGAPEASVSARLRDLRKPRNGSAVVERRRVSSGLYQYRLVVAEQPQKTDAQRISERVAREVVLDLLSKVTGNVAP